MIGLIQNHTIYEYDIRSLILAFMLGEKIELTDDVSSIYDFILKVFYGENEVFMELFQKGKLKDSTKIQGDYQDKKSFKNHLKKGVYQLFSKTLNKELPWGTLTGIRPTKIVFDGFSEGKTEREIVQHFQQDYLASEEKASLCTQVVKREQELLAKLPYKEGYSLYVGIPFCPSTCLYCSFTSYPVSSFQDMIPQYLTALMKEAAYVKEAYKDKQLQTLYIGGGTPTALSADDLRYLLSHLSSLFDFSSIGEITVEAGRPDSIDKEKLDVLIQYGVTRISINPQSMNDKTLKLIGRNHSVEDVKKKFYMAREVGFANINMDTICGLPEEGMTELENTYEQIQRLDPESLTVHSLAIKRSSELSQRKDQYHYGASEEMVSYANQSAKAMGMAPYYLYRQKNIPGNLENVGFSKKTKECFYNILIMEELHDIIAIGAGTSTKILNRKEHSIARIENLKDVSQYMERIDEMIHRKELKMNWK